LQGAEEVVKVPKKETLELNQPHIFKLDASGNIVLEDALVFNTKNIMEKAKLIEMCLKLAPIVAKIDFTKPEALML